MGELRFRLLGDIEAWYGDEYVELGGPKQRSVLAVLLINVERIVPSTELVAAVWGLDPPITARNLVHSYISRLRAVFARIEISDQLQLIGRRPGYVLYTDRANIDLHLFQKLFNKAKAAKANDFDLAASLLQEALDLWRGQPFAGFDTAHLRGIGDSMEESRLDAVEELADIELRRGQQSQTLQQLRDLVGRHPGRERLAALLMRALFAAGRRAEALAVYRRARNQMIDELGLPPTCVLEEVHQAILRDALPR